MEIGAPKRIIEVEPVELPVRGAVPIEEPASPSPRGEPSIEPVPIEMPARR